MEFFSYADVQCDEQKLQHTLSMDKLDTFCASIENTIDSTEDRGRYFTIWGEFEILRIEIKGGYRFVMPKCPNALTWSVTTGFAPYPEKLTIHTSINRNDHEPDFVETLVDFTKEWRVGLEESTVWYQAG
jgi:hypothetical protein